MFLGVEPAEPHKVGFPRIRGDVPCTRAAAKFVTAVFPAYAGMFRDRCCPFAWSARFPRIRGDVPGVFNVSAKPSQFSPHTRGCSGCRLLAATEVAVFPAYAGMFLFRPIDAKKTACFPRIRGDVPLSLASGHRGSQFSPHTRGCSPHLKVFCEVLRVFPAYAGMFRCQLCCMRSISRFPRIRGDVPAHENMV